MIPLGRFLCCYSEGEVISSPRYEEEIKEPSKPEPRQITRSNGFTNINQLMSGITEVIENDGSI